MSREFRLQRVLRLRGQLRRMAEAQARHAEAQVRDLQGQRQDTERRAENALSGLQAETLGSLADVGRVAAAHEYVRGMEIAGARLDVAIAEAKGQAEQLRTTVVAARTEERKLERLSEIHDARAQAEEARTTQNELDERAARGRSALGVPGTREPH